MSPSRFQRAVSDGVAGTTMAAFGSLLTPDQIWELHAFVVSRDRLDDTLPDPDP
jgi:mono/diheme cytochrome c family protein